MRQCLWKATFEYVWPHSNNMLTLQCFQYRRLLLCCRYWIARRLFLPAAKTMEFWYLELYYWIKTRNRWIICYTKSRLTTTTTRKRRNSWPQYRCTFVCPVISCIRIDRSRRTNRRYCRRIENIRRCSSGIRLRLNRITVKAQFYSEVERAFTHFDFS